MYSLWGAVFIQVLDRTGPLMLNLSGTPYMYVEALCLRTPEIFFVDKSKMCEFLIPAFWLIT
jgi:hypothetical protein